MLFSKQMMCFALSLSLANAMIHTALSPRSHQLHVDTQKPIHTQAMFDQGSREDEIIEASERRVQAAKQFVETERARIEAHKADLEAQHTAAKAAIASTRTELHGRMQNSGLFTALPAADPAAVAPAAPASLTGRPAGFLQRQAAEIRLEDQLHAEKVAALDRQLVDLNDEYKSIQQAHAQELRELLEETRIRTEQLEQEQLTFDHNAAERLMRHHMEAERARADAAVTAHDAAQRTLGTARRSRRDAAIAACGGRPVPTTPAPTTTP